ncbi:MAG: S9 family peptidase [Prevotellaceae bacterium]|nr:S9 family peptidase [Prevotellaceae bacterium]
MKKLLFVLLIFACNISLSAQNRELLKDVADGKFVPQRPAQMHSLSDGESYAQLSADGKKIIKYSYKTGKAIETLFDASTTRGDKVPKIDGFSFSPNEKMMFVYTNSEALYRRSFLAVYYTFDVQRNRLEALTDNGEKVRDPLFSPDGFNVVYAKGNDLYLKKLLYGTTTAVTQNGSETFVNGITDWLYEEEFGITSLIQWSPDSKRIAFVSLDLTEVGTQHFVINDNLYPIVKSLKYPKAGTANPKPLLFVFDVYYAKLQKVNIENENTDIYMPRLKWTNSAEDVALFTLSRNQDVMTMYVVNSKSLIANPLFSEKSDTFVDYRNIDYVQFLNDGRFSYTSERDGYRHLYLYRANGMLDKQLTQGNYDVTGFYGYDSIKKLFYYQAAETSPLNREIYSVDLKDKKTRLAGGNFYHRAQFNKTFTYFLDATSTLNTPTIYSIHNASGKEVRIVETNADLKEKMAKLPQKEFITLKTDNGTELNTWILKPADFSESKKYPVVLCPYNAPNFQNATNDFRVGIEQYLVSQGVIVVCVDGRGTGGRGTEFRNAVYMQLGQLEAHDQVAAAKELGKLSYIDPARIGIWGWSYGGFTTLMAMSTGEKVFATGVAVAPLTDFKFYDTAYIERYMRRPQENLTGNYNQTPLTLANKLNGKLLLVHGTADDNVHIQNTYKYAETLTEANKQFQMQIYSDLNHNIKGGNARYHLYVRIADFLIDNL